MKLGKKGMLAPFTILTSIVTGIGFPLLGTFIAIDLNVIDTLYFEGLILVIIGGFTAQWIFAHTIHDIYHIDREKRITFSKKILKILLILSVVILLLIASYLTIQRGWPIIIFSMIGGLFNLVEK